MADVELVGKEKQTFEIAVELQPGMIDCLRRIIMGRILRRVPLDFDWPLKKVWDGFVNPNEEGAIRECKRCRGTGLSTAARSWVNRWYGTVSFYPEETGSIPLEPTEPFILDHIRAKVTADEKFYRYWFGGVSLEKAIQLEAKRMCEFWNGAWQHHLSQEDVQVLWEKERLFRMGELTECPTAAEVNRHPSYLFGMGHDALNEMYCVEARMKRANLPVDCPTCKGKGRFWVSEETRKLVEEWQPTDPPAGEGWQVWETVSEGSPISPVFATSGQLVEWLIEQGYSAAAAHGFVQTGWVASAYWDGETFYMDIEACAIQRLELTAG